MFFLEKRLTVLGSAMFQRWHCKYPRTKDQRPSEKVCFVQVREMSRTVNAAQMKLVEGEEGDKLELPSLMEVLFIVSFIHKGSMFSLIYFIRC